MTDLADQIRALDGVVDAEVTLDDDGPPSIQVRLAPGADQRGVAEAVQVLLSRQGLRSRVAPPRVKLEPSTPPLPPAEEGPATPGSARPAAGREGLDQLFSAAAGDAGWQEVAVVERSREVEVRVTIGGRTATVVTVPKPQAVTRALVQAVARLVQGEEAPVPELVDSADLELGGMRVIVVALDRGDGTLLVGAAPVRVGAEAAMAKAVLRALVD